MQKMPVSAATYLTRVESLTVHHRFDPHISYLTILPLDARYSLKIFHAHGLTVGYGCLLVVCICTVLYVRMSISPWAHILETS